jgi:hypothetical protein
MQLLGALMFATCQLVIVLLSNDIDHHRRGIGAYQRPPKHVEITSEK